MSNTSYTTQYRKNTKKISREETAVTEIIFIRVLRNVLFNYIIRTNERKPVVQITMKVDWLRKDYRRLQTLVNRDMRPQQLGLIWVLGIEWGQA